MDTSPPRPGAVMDGPEGQPDIDYQKSLELHAHWDGFFDHESGILLYKYAFSRICLNAEHFASDNEQVSVDIFTNVSRNMSVYLSFILV